MPKRQNDVKQEREEKMKVLWFSRHKMTPEQMEALRAKVGEFELVQISKTINSAFELKDEVEECDVIAIVAPINIQSQFLKIAGDKPVITALSRRELIKKEDGEDEVKFVFEKWQRIEKIEVVMSDFC